MSSSNKTNSYYVVVSVLLNIRCPKVLLIQPYVVEIYSTFNYQQFTLNSFTVFSIIKISFSDAIARRSKRLINFSTLKNITLLRMFLLGPKRSITNKDRFVARSSPINESVNSKWVEYSKR